MEPTSLFELMVVMLLAIILLHYAAHRLGLPPAVAVSLTKPTDRNC